MTVRDPSIYEHPWLVEHYASQGHPVGELGCVMLPVLFPAGVLERGYEIGILDRSDLYFSEDPSRWWITGDVREKAHVTLLYGLLEKAYEQDELIARLLEDWAAPAGLPIIGYEGFSSPYPDEPYVCIVARVDDSTGALATARGRLEYLPHINTFPEWKLHATVAYVHKDSAEAWLSYLSGRSVSHDFVTVGQRDGRAVLDLGRRG